MSKASKTLFVVLGRNIRGSKDIIKTPLLDNLKGDINVRVINDVLHDDVMTDERLPKSIRAKLSWFPFVFMFVENKTYYYHPHQKQDSQNLLEWIDNPEQYRHRDHPKKFGLTHRQIRHSDAQWNVFTVRDIEMYYA